MGSKKELKQIVMIIMILFLMLNVCQITLGMTLNESEGKGITSIDKSDSTLISVKDFGAKGDGITDDTAAIQNAINSCRRGHTLTLQPNKNYLITSTLFFPYDINFNGNYAKIIMASSGHFIKNYAIYFNLNSRSELVEPYPNFLVEIYNIYIEPDSKTNFTFNFLYFAGQGTIHHIRSNYIDIVVKIHDDYQDMVSVTDCIISRRNSSNYAIYSGYLGDNRNFINIHQPTGAYLGTGLEKTLYVGKAHLNVYIRNLIGGVTDIYSPSNIENCLFNVNSELNIYGSNCTITNCSFTYNGNRCLTLQEYNFSNVSVKPYIILRNSSFKIYNSTPYARTIVAPIYVSNINGIELNGTYFTSNVDSTTFNNVISPVRIEGLPNYSKYAPFLFSPLVENEITSPITINYTPGYPVRIDTYSNKGINKSTFNGTYYFKFITIYDYERGIAELSPVEQTASYSRNQGIFSYLKNISYHKNRIFLRIYRGKSPGSYNSYVDVPVSGSCIFDDGITVNGYPWVSCVQADYEAFVTTIGNILYGFTFEVNDCIKGYGQSIPIKGSWKQGDIIIFLENVKYFASKCVVDGTPGTWLKVAFSQ